MLASSALRLDRVAARCAPFALAAVLAWLTACEPTTSSLETDQVSTSFASAASASALPGRFVVLLTPRTDPGEVARAHGISPQYLYRDALVGFAGSISDAARAGLLRDARVSRVEPDRPFTADGGVESAAPWGLDRIDQRTSRDGNYTYGATGRGVTVYILDSGIRFSHTDFGGRAVAGYDALGGDGSDCYGHGTHVAGTVGGAAYGVAKGAQLVSVRVLDCRGAGSTSTVLAGLDWIMAHAARPAAMNISLGGGPNAIVDSAVRQVIAAGIPAGVAAGNSATDACFYSPARVAEAMTIAASDSTDAAASFSNFGSCVDWYAPGVGIRSAGMADDQASKVMSGTSMAAPHATGAAALFLELHPDATAQDVASALSSLATSGAISGVGSLKGGSSHGNLLYTGSLTASGTGSIDSTSAGLDPVVSAPVAAFTDTCGRLACSFVDASADPGGVIVQRQWNYGDGSAPVDAPETGSDHSYTASGVYQVSLTVTNSAGLSSSAVRQVDVGVLLSVSSRKVKGHSTATLSWTGATSATVTVYVDGAAAGTVANPGSFVFTTPRKGQNSYIFRVCETGVAGAVCSADVPATM